MKLADADAFYRLEGDVAAAKVLTSERFELLERRIEHANLQIVTLSRLTAESFGVLEGRVAELEALCNRLTDRAFRQADTITMLCEILGAVP